MDAAILQQATEKRKLRALRIVEAGLVSPNGLDGQYYVQSESGNGTYIAHHRRVTDGAVVCGCPDAFAKKHGIPCKHVQAVEIYENAETYALALVERHSITFDKLERRILYDLARPLPELDAIRLTILLHAVQRLADDQAMWDAVDRRIEELKDAEHQLPVLEAMQ